MCNVTLTQETKDSVTSLVKENILGSIVQIHEGPTMNGNHLHLTVINDQFEGLPLLDQHKMIMNAIGQKFTEGLHAIKLKTLTTKKAQDKGLI